MIETKLPSPEMVAAYWHHAEGFIWLDTAGFSSSLTEKEDSLLAWNPDFILQGSSQEWPLLEKRFQEHVASLSPQERSRGAAIGYRSFEGAFTLGFYPLVYRYRWDKKAQQGAWLGATPPLPSTTPPLSTLPSQGSQQAGKQVEQQNTKKKQQENFLQQALQSSTTCQEYQEMVRCAQEEICQGNIYQVCLAHELGLPLKTLQEYFVTQKPEIASLMTSQVSSREIAWELYQRLRHTSPAPFAAYMSLSGKEILSSSPESFLAMKGASISTRPIKGTMRRSPSSNRNEELDYQISQQLLHSPKERAELLMITDLERNDLGQVCQYGSVQTPHLLTLEEYPHLFHLVSTVTGKLRPEVSHLAAFDACFPGGSISGAPKKRALLLIKQWEKTTRGLFTGSLGYFGYNGESHWNIAIRTMVLEKERLSFHVGAGITINSDPVSEWEETLNKAEGMLQALGIPTSL